MVIDSIAIYGDDRGMRYPGGKNSCFQRLINLIPPHNTYIETHLGSGAVMRRKRIADGPSIAFERDPRVVEKWRASGPLPFQLVCGDALQCLNPAAFTGKEFVYADPPYLPETRRRARVYRFDYDENEHRRLLAWLLALPCPVMVSGYRSNLYDEQLGHWQRVDFQAKTHSGTRMESVWLSYVPQELHDTRYLGDDFRERERLRRIRTRWMERFGKLKRAQQQYLLEALTKVYQPEGGP